MQLRTVCDKCLQVHITSGSFEAKISIDIANVILFVTFYVFWNVFSKNVKSHVFMKSETNIKYVFSNTA